MNEAPENPRKLVAVAVGGTLAATLGAATGPLAPFTTAAILPLTTRMAELMLAELSRKNTVVAAAALQASGLDPEEFCEILAGDPAKMGLAQKILWVASTSGNENQLQILGALLGGAVAGSGDKLDETRLIVAALDDIDAPHTAVLEVLTRPAPDEEEQKRATTGALGGGLTISSERTGDELMAWAPGAWLPEQIQNELPMSPGFVFACLSVLTRHDLARSLGTLGGGQRFRITDFGLAMLDAMTEAAAHPATPGKSPGGSATPAT